MWVDEDVLLLPGRADGLSRLVVCRELAVEGLAQAPEKLVAYGVDALRGKLGHPAAHALAVPAREVVEHALEVGRDEDVHRGGDRLHEVAATVVAARPEEVGEHLVGVGGHDEPPDGKAESLGIVAGEHVAKVARGHAEVDGIAQADGATPHELGIRVNIVDDLRDETTNIDGVGTREGDAPPVEPP